MFTSSSRPFTLLGTVIATLVLGLIPARASADTLVVLGFSSLDGDVEFAQALSSALREAADEIDGWEVVPGQVTLSQMMLVHDCQSGANAECLGRIAAALNAQNLIFGELHNEATEATPRSSVSLSLFSVASGSIAATESGVVGIPDSSEWTAGSLPPSLMRDARLLMSRLIGPEPGSLVVVSETPNALVHVDDRLAGRTDESGQLVVEDVVPGAHNVHIEADGREPYDGEIVVPPAERVVITASLVLVPDTQAPDEHGPGAEFWAGWGLIGLGAVAFAGSIYSWARLDAISQDLDWRAYRSGWTPPAPPDVCVAARSRAPNGEGTLEVQQARADRAADFCDEADLLEVLQYVFLGTALAAAAGGVLLLVLDGQDDGGESAQVAILPSVSSDGARLRLVGRF